jgi:hypothetical protein
LQKLGAEIVVAASLMVMGKRFADFAKENNLPLETLAEVPFEVWTPEECPLCRANSAFEVVG